MIKLVRDKDTIKYVDDGIPSEVSIPVILGTNPPSKVVQVMYGQSKETNKPVGILNIYSANFNNLGIKPGDHVDTDSIDGDMELINSIVFADLRSLKRTVTDLQKIIDMWMEQEEHERQTK